MSGFRKTGLFPFNLSAVDDSKLAPSDSFQQPDEDVSTYDSDTQFPLEITMKPQLSLLSSLLTQNLMFSQLNNLNYSLRDMRKALMLKILCMRHGKAYTS